MKIMTGMENWLELERARNPEPAVRLAPARFAQARMKDLWPGTLREVAGEYVANMETLIAEGIAPLFIGQAGTGKTTAATAIFRVVHEYHRIDAQWESVPSLFPELLRLGWRSASIVSQLSSIPFLFLDDIGVIKQNSPSFDLWLDILSKRFDAMRPTMYTANLTLNSDDPFRSLVDLYGPLVERRLKKGSGDYALSLLSVG